MKIKQDFVTNSSSTSYVVFGITIPYDFESIPLKLRLKYFEKNKIEDEETIDIDEMMYEMRDNLPFSTFIHPDYDDMYIGYDITDMNEDETLRQFKQRIVDKLNEYGFDITYDDIHYIEETTSN